MNQRIASVTLVVRDYDEAIAWFRDRLGFRLVEDVDMGGGKRWVVMAPAVGPGGMASGARLVLGKAQGAAQTQAIGNQAGGRVCYFLETDDFARDHAAMTAMGVVFHEEPRHEAYGSVAVFEDLYGNLWDLLEPKSPL